MIRFIHTADIHLGTENYGKVDPKTGIHSRLLDFSVALDFCIDTALEKGVDFFLFCGDAYKTATPSPTQQKILLNALLRLYKANIPTVIIVGNHDNPVSFGKVNSLDIFRDLPLEGFHVISQAQTVRLVTKNGPISIVGIPWPTRNSMALNSKYMCSSAHEMSSYISKAVGSIIEHEAKKLDPTEPALLAAHLTVSTGRFSGSEKQAILGNDPLFMPSQLAIQPFDYVALGHLHRHQDLNKNGNIPIVYPGSIERIDFGEKEEKGFCLVSISSKGHAEYEFIKGPMRPFIQIEARLNNESDMTEQLIDEIRKHSIEGAVLKIVYHMPEGVKDGVNLKELHIALSCAHHVASVIPIMSHSTRQLRPAMKIDMDMSTLLDTYFESKQYSKEKKERLIEQALSLYEESKQKEVKES